MEPLTLPEGAQGRGKIIDRALMLAQKASGLRRALPDGLLVALATLVRSIGRGPAERRAGLRNARRMAYPRGSGRPPHRHQRRRRAALPRAVRGGLPWPGTHRCDPRRGLRHNRLLWVHPFVDGNGRVARLMSHAVLLDTLDTGAVWSVARGLARQVETYKRHLVACDQPRRNDLECRGSFRRSRTMRGLGSLIG